MHALHARVQTFPRWDSSSGRSRLSGRCCSRQQQKWSGSPVRECKKDWLTKKSDDWAFRRMPTTPSSLLALVALLEEIERGSAWPSIPDQHVWTFEADAMKLKSSQAVEKSVLHCVAVCLQRFSSNDSWHQSRLVIKEGSWENCLWDLVPQFSWFSCFFFSG